MPAPPGNRNAVKHGGYIRVSISGLPKKYGSIRKKGEGLRRLLEAAVLELRGNIGTTDALHIHSAVSHEILASIWERRIRDEWATLTTEQQLSVTQTVSRERDKRDSAVAKLGLDKAETSASIAELYRTPELIEVQTVDNKTPENVDESTDQNETTTTPADDIWPAADTA